MRSRTAHGPRPTLRVHTWPITLDICRAISDLDFHGDPADEIIAATSVVHRVPLLTPDRQLRARGCRLLGGLGEVVPRLSDLAHDRVVGVGVLQHVEHVVLDRHRLVDAPEFAILAGEPRLHA